jgi:hypothetical protein
VRTKGREPPDASSPWAEIVPRLFMGGYFYRDVAGNRAPVVVGDEFDLVISLCSRDGHGPGSGVEHLSADIPDYRLSVPQLELVCDLAELAVSAVRDGRRVLVRCHAGYNRSGLVTGQALITMGFTAADAISLIRARRSGWALNNALFAGYLTAGLDVAWLAEDLALRLSVDYSVWRFREPKSLADPFGIQLSGGYGHRQVECLIVG